MLCVSGSKDSKKPGRERYLGLLGDQWSSCIFLLEEEKSRHRGGKSLVRGHTESQGGSLLSHDCETQKTQTHTLVKSRGVGSSP